MKTTVAANVIAVARGFCHYLPVNKFNGYVVFGLTDGKQLGEQGVIFCSLRQPNADPLWA